MRGVRVLARDIDDDRADTGGIDRRLDIVVIAIGIERADPLIGLPISVLILRITWQALRTVRADNDRPR